MKDKHTIDQEKLKNDIMNLVQEYNSKHEYSIIFIDLYSNSKGEYSISIK